MKALLIITLLSFSIVGFSQDKITVLFVKGKVTNSKTKQVVKRGTKLTLQDQLNYGSKNDMIAAISPSKGRIIIKPQTGKAKSSSELAFVIKDIYTPMKGTAMTRGVGGSEGFANDAVVKAYFQQNTFLLLPKNKVAFDSEEYPLNENSFFFIRYDLEGDEQPVNKKLSYEGNEVIINRDELLTVDDEAVSAESASRFILFYLQEGKEPKGIAALDFYFPEENEVEEELRLIKESGVENPWSEASAYMKEAYGEFDSDELKALFESL